MNPDVHDCLTLEMPKKERERNEENGKGMRKLIHRILSFLLPMSTLQFPFTSSVSLGRTNDAPLARIFANELAHRFRKFDFQFQWLAKNWRILDQDTICYACFTIIPLPF